MTTPQEIHTLTDAIALIEALAEQHHLKTEGHNIGPWTTCAIWSCYDARRKLAALREMQAEIINKDANRQRQPQPH